MIGRTMMAAGLLLLAGCGEEEAEPVAVANELIVTGEGQAVRNFAAWVAAQPEPKPTELTIETGSPASVTVRLPTDYSVAQVKRATRAALDAKLSYHFRRIYKTR